MRIFPVNNIQSNLPVFKGSITPVKILPAVSDVFVKTPLSETEIIKENLYKNIISKLSPASPEEITKIIKNLVSRYDTDEKNVLNVLSRVTTYSGYKSLGTIQKNLAKEGVNILGRIPLYEGIKHDEIPVCISGVLRYILMKNGKIPSAKENGQQGIILDSELLKYAENAPKEYKDKLLETLSKSKLIYLEDFENSFNFLNRKDGLKNYACNIFDFLKNGSPLDQILNENLAERAKNLGLDVTVIRNTTPKNPTEQTIADNINPIFPSKEDFSLTLDSVMNKNFEGPEEIKYKKYVLNFTEKLINPISAPQYASYLKDINKKIEKFISQKGKNPEHTYFILPTMDKSFITAIYQYKKANNIDKVKCIIPQEDWWYDRFYNLKEIPKDSTLVILDDCILTGLTMTKDAFSYSKNARKLDNISVIFASVVGTKRGVNNIKELIKVHGREKKDTVITGTTVQEWVTTSSVSDVKYLDLYSSFPYLTAITLPYIGPDTNCELLHPLLKKFLFSPKAQKPSNKNLDFAMNL